MFLLLCVAVGAVIVMAVLRPVSQLSQSTPTVAGVGLLDNRVGDLSAASSPARYSYVVLNQSDYGQIPALKAANPDVKILVYKDMAATVSDSVTSGVDWPLLPTGVGYASANSNHPEWFLTDTAGRRIQWADYSARWWMDVGSQSYQDAWAANVAAELKKYGVNGVMIDDTNAQLGGHKPAGVTVAKYPTDAAYAAATESFLARVGPKLTAAGFLPVPNIAFYWNPAWQSLYTRWVSYVSGALLEFWTKPGQDSSYARFGGGDWDFQMQEMNVVASAGKVFLPVTYGAMSDTATQRYSRASFLLGWDGGVSANIWTPTGPNTDPWTPDWTTDVGQPVVDRYQVNGAWRRDFSNGTVLVNPSRTLTLAVALGGTYYQTDGTPVSAVTLPPTSGLILTNRAAELTTDH